MPELNALIDVFCAKLGIPQDNVTMYGSSAGGTSAILVGSQRKTKTGIVAVCPFLRPDKYREGVVAAGMRAIVTSVTATTPEERGCLSIAANSPKKSPAPISRSRTSRPDTDWSLTRAVPLTTKMTSLV